MGKLSKIVLFVMLVVAGLMGILSLTSDTALAGTVKTGAISSPGESWVLAYSPYWIEGNLTIESGASLTIYPGVEVRFNGFYSIFVDGNLSIMGTPSNRIAITSNYTSPAPGDWNAIHIRSTGHAEIHYSDISYGRQGVLIRYSAFNNITNNNIVDNSLLGISLPFSSNNSIRSNNIMNSGDDGIYLHESSNNIITENNILNSGDDGIYFWRSSNNTLANNTIDNKMSNNDDGIFLVGSTNNTLAYNDVLYNGHDGIYILGSSHNTISNNNFKYNFDGIRPQLASYNEILFNNASNNHHGISFESSGPSDNNTVMGNDITNNKGYGLYLPSGTDNRIYLNRFINNSINALDNTGNNFWNSTYPNGGNYWDDYEGVDEFSGPNQDIPGADGIGDTPYLGIVGDAGAKDYYPLMIKPDEVHEPFYTILLQPVPVIAISIAITVGLLVGATEFGKYGFILFFIPFYTRIKKEDVLDHFIRGRIYEHIRKNPGDNFNSMKKEFGLKNGSLGYHLSILEKQDYIKSRRDGKYTRFYPVGMKIPEKPKMILSSVQQNILDLITQKEMMTQKEIADALDISQQVVSYHVNLMIESEILGTAKEDNVLKYFPEDFQEGKNT
jgi:parallel beta-helix repeat protein